MTILTPPHTQPIWLPSSHTQRVDSTGVCQGTVFFATATKQQKEEPEQHCVAPHMSRVAHPVQSKVVHKGPCKPCSSTPSTHDACSVARMHGSFTGCTHIKHTCCMLKCAHAWLIHRLHTHQAHMMHAQMHACMHGSFTG